jgi:DEAD/DEAH box helicase domain-containing protein
MAIKAGLKTLVFAQSRTMVEVLTKYLKDVFDHDPRKPARIRAYRGGYLPTERRAAERDDARRAHVDGIVSTSALELGVDIGSLDVVVLNGYPGSIAATWQRFGRAGRRQQAALGVLVASSRGAGSVPGAASRVLRRRAAGTGAHRAGPALILLDHIRCAAFELPFVDGRALRHGRSARVTSPCWPNPACCTPRPAPRVDRRQLSGERGVTALGGRRQFRGGGSQRRPPAPSSPRSITAAAALMLYEGAIHMVQSVPYQVERLDWDGRKAYVTRTHVDYYTDAIDYTKLKVLARFRRRSRRAASAQHGEVHVVRRVSGYKKIRYYSHENIGYGPVNLPDQELHTTAVWWQLPHPCSSAFASRQDALDGLLGAAYALHTVATDRGDGRRRAICRRPSAAAMVHGSRRPAAMGTGSVRHDDAADRNRSMRRNGSSPTIYLYDNLPGWRRFERALVGRGRPN